MTRPRRSVPISERPRWPNVGALKSVTTCSRTRQAKALERVLPAEKPLALESEFSLIIMMDGWMVRERGSDWGASLHKRQAQRIQCHEIKSAVIFHRWRGGFVGGGRGSFWGCESRHWILTRPAGICGPVVMPSMARELRKPKIGWNHCCMSFGMERTCERLDVWKNY